MRISSINKRWNEILEMEWGASGTKYKVAEFAYKYMDRFISLAFEVQKLKKNREIWDRKDLDEVAEALIKIVEENKK